MKHLYQQFRQLSDPCRVRRNAEELYRIGRTQTAPFFRPLAEKAAEFLRREGIPEVELLSFPSDGKSVFADRYLPYAWTASVGRLTLLNAPYPASWDHGCGGKTAPDPCVADLTRNPLHLIEGSTALPRGGVEVRILTEAQFLSGMDARGTLVMLEPETLPNRNVLTPILDRGGLGLITDCLSGRHETPDDLPWITGCTENHSHYADCETRPFSGFCVTPRIGTWIRTAASHTTLKALAECDGKRFAGDAGIATARIPGRRPEEIWLYSSLCGPLATQSAAGISSAVECARLLLGEVPEFSVRVLFSMGTLGLERYKAMRNSIMPICICDMEHPVSSKNCIGMGISAAGPGFYGISLLKTLMNSLQEEKENPSLTFSETGGCSFGGIPTIRTYEICRPPVFHHNSIRDMHFIDTDVLRQALAFHSAFIHAMVCPQPEYPEKVLNQILQQIAILRRSARNTEEFRYKIECERSQLADFARIFPTIRLAPLLKQLDQAASDSGALPTIRQQSLWRDYAERLIPDRTVYPIYNGVKIPPELRPDFFGGLRQGPVGHIIDRMDGSKTLGRLIRETEHAGQMDFSEADVKKTVNIMGCLAQYGYLRWDHADLLTADQIAKALHELGIRKGDLLLFHSSLTTCGLLEKGPETLLDALHLAVGADGTVLFPTFSRCWSFNASGLNKSWHFRPYAQQDFSSLGWTGVLPKYFMLTHPDAPRSRHITHSWAGFGPLAAVCTHDQQPFDTPMGFSGPMAKAMEYGGKIVHFGNSIASTTFLHFIEDAMNIPCMGTALCHVRNEDGSSKQVLIRKFPSGDRNWYHDPEHCRFFTEAQRKGLRIHRTKLGLGELKMMDAAQLFRIGCELCQADQTFIT